MTYKTIPLMLICLMAGFLSAQDMERMQRDIEVAENILASLMQEEREAGMTSGVLWGPAGSIEGSYIKDFGVLFSIAPRHRLRGVVVNKDKVFIRSGEEGVIVSPEEPSDAEEAIVEESDQREEERFRRLVEIFATDYAYLLRQLPADEKVMIRFGAKSNRFFRGTGVWTISGSQTGGAYSAVIKNSDVDALQKGRISEEQLRNRIEFTVEKEETTEKDRDLEILTNIFTTLYQDDSDRSIGLRGAPRYEKIEGLGAIVYLSAGPPGGYSYTLSGTTTLQFFKYDRAKTAPKPLKEKESKDQAELSRELSSAFPEFMGKLEEHIVEYGSIVRSLGENEVLIFRIDFFDCPDCNVLPEEVEITAQQPTLMAYRKGELSLADAIGRLKTEKKEN